MTGRPRVLIVAMNFPPDAAIGTMRTLRLVDGLVADDWDITVLTVAPSSYFHGTVRDEALIARVPPGVRVLHAPVLRPLDAIGDAIARMRFSKAAPLDGAPAPAAAATAVPRRRGMKETLRVLTSLPDREVGWVVPAIVRGWRHGRPDVLYSTAPAFTAHLVASTLAQLWGRPWIADFRDPWARAPWRDDRLALEKRGWAWFERRYITRADRVLFTTRTNRDEFAAHYGADAAARFHVVRNGCDPTEFAHVQVRQASGQFTLLHAGSLYGARSPMPLLRAVASAARNGRLARGAFLLQFIGRVGLPGVDLAAVVADLGIADLVRFVPHVSRSVILTEMASSSALLLLQPGTTVSIPGKAYEYLAAGRPILALAEEGETADLVREAGAGVVVNPSDERAIESALVALVRGGPSQVVAAPPKLFDGRLGAAETAAMLRELASRVSPVAREAARVGRPGGTEAARPEHAETL